MMLLGTVINTVSIIIGSVLGLFINKISNKYKETIMHGIALVVLLIGLQMAFETKVVIVVLISLLLGAIIGELINLDSLFNKLGYQISRRFIGDGNASQVTEAFISATLLFVVGAMAILGSLDSGLRGDHEILFTKSILDGFTSLILTSTLGFGVILSAIPVFIYQGTITLLSSQIVKVIPEQLLEGLINELTAVGGLLIVAISLNLLKITKIRIANLLPAIVIVMIVYIVYFVFWKWPFTDRDLSTYFNVLVITIAIS